MKLRHLFVVLVLASLVAASCQTTAGNWSGTWNTNIARLTLKQNGQEVTGLLEGYGDQWRQQVAGTLQGNTLTLEGENPLGLAGIELDPSGDTFHSVDPKISFCGSRTRILPEGCGFSGKWNLNAPDLFPTGSYALLQQDADKVSGKILDASGATLMQVDAQVTWGKGWQAQWQNYTASMSADEKAFLILLDGSNAGQWCALRDGVESAYLFSFDCTVP